MPTKKPILAGSALEYGSAGAAGDGFSNSHSSGFSWECQEVSLSPVSAAQLNRLAEKTGLPPSVIVDSLVAAADPQLVGVAVREARRRGLAPIIGLG